MSIPTYIINLKHRTDRYKSILCEFKNRSEFNITVMPAIKNQIGSIGLWQSISKVISIAEKQKLKYVLICEDDHSFTDNYCPKKLINHIEIAIENNANVLLGGVSWFDYCIKFNNDFYWVNSFTGTQFLIVFENFYKQILSHSFKKNLDTIDFFISKLSDKIFVLFPMFSVQKDTGYSDVTMKNDSKGIVQNLFKNVELRVKQTISIQNHIQLTNLMVQEKNYDDLQISTFIINNIERTERFKHIKKEFLYRDEFGLEFISLKNDKINEKDSWNNLKHIISIAIDRNEDVIIICSDNHRFTNTYEKKTLFDSIFQGAQLSADIILGGISHTDHVIVASPELCWIESFRCTQFIVLFKTIFRSILDESFDETDIVDVKLSTITPNKYIIHPFISKQIDLDNNDIPLYTSTIANNYLFEKIETKLNKIRTVHKTINY